MKKLIYLVLIITICSCGDREPKIEMIEDENLTQHQIDSILTAFKFEYDSPVFIDSTSQILLPITTKPLERTKSYSKYSSDGYYSDNYPEYWNILFYNKDSGETKLLTESKLQISGYEVNLKKAGPILSNSILYKIGDTDYNKDNKLNYKDPIQLFISKIDGSNFKRLSPINEDLESYTVIPNSDKILVRTRRDTNTDSEFKIDDEQIWYMIDLNSESSPIEVANAVQRKKIENLYFKQWLKKK